jgi:GPH family glycoside/pentoside/hexuronide:cation symporter
MKEQESVTVGITEQRHHIPFSMLAAYGAGGIIPIALFNIAGQLVGLMGNISLGLSAFWLGVILIIPRLWDAISDPVIGHLSDNTRTRWGRRRPYLLIGGILVAVFFVVMWWIPKGDLVRAWFPSESGFHWFQLSYILFSLLLFFTATTIFEIPHGALGMEMTTDYHERTRLFSAKSFVGNIFAMSTPWLFALANTEAFKGTGGNEADGMRYVSLIIAAILVPLSFWWFFKLREPGFVKAEKQEKTKFWKDMKLVISNRNFVKLTMTIFTLAMGFNFVNLLGSYIPIFYVFGGDKVAGARLLGINGTIWAITGVLAVFPLNWISPKLGKRNTLIIAILLMCLAQLSKIICYNPAHPYLIIIPTMLLSAGMLFFFTLGSSMVGDICDEDELNTGSRTEGSYYSVFWWFIKMGTALASFIAGILITITMFDETQVTKVDAFQGDFKELHSKVRYWEDNKGLSPENSEWLKNTRTEVDAALRESNDYVTYLEKETAKKQEQTKKGETALKNQRKIMLMNTLAATKSAAGNLESLQLRLGNIGSQASDSIVKSIVKESIPLTLQTKLEKARISSFELMSHLEVESLKPVSQKNKKSNAHYNVLIGNISEVNNRLSGMDAATSLEVLDQELGQIETGIILLKKQAPFTLIMMRIVEIGLPLLLSIFSIFFIVRYSLTEKRSHEIKDLLAQRNREHKKEAGNDSEPVII